MKGFLIVQPLILCVRPYYLYSFYMYFLFSNSKGAVALITAIIIALFLFSVASLLLIQSNTSISSGQFETQADRAQFLAETGVQHALINIARDSSYVSASTITETDGTINITITQPLATTSIIVATSSVTQGSETVQWTVKATVVYTTSGTITSVTKVNQ